MMRRFESTWLKNLMYVYSNSDYDVSQPKCTSVVSKDRTGESGYVFNPFLDDSSNESTEVSVVDELDILI